MFKQQNGQSWKINVKKSIFYDRQNLSIWEDAAIKSKITFR